MDVKFKLGLFARDKISSDLHRREFDHFGPFICTAHTVRACSGLAKTRFINKYGFCTVHTILFLQGRKSMSESGGGDTSAALNY